MSDDTDASDAKKRGRAPWEPTDYELGQIEGMAASGAEMVDIVLILGKSRDSILRRAREVYELGRAKMRVKLGSKMVQKALAGDNTMLCFVGKTMLGLRETDRLEHTGPDGGAIEVTRIERIIVDPRDRDHQGLVH